MCCTPRPPLKAVVRARPCAKTRGAGGRLVWSTERAVRRHRAPRPNLPMTTHTRTAPMCGPTSVHAGRGPRISRLGVGEAPARQPNARACACLRTRACICARVSMRVLSERRGVPFLFEHVCGLVGRLGDADAEVVRGRLITCVCNVIAPCTPDPRRDLGEWRTSRFHALRHTHRGTAWAVGMAGLTKCADQTNQMNTAT